MLMGDAFSVSAGVVDLVTEVPRPENRLIWEPSSYANNLGLRI